MQARARDCLRTRTPLPELQQLVDDAAALPVHVPDVEAVSALLAKAQDWLKRAQVAASQVSYCSPLLGILLSVSGEVQHACGPSVPAGCGGFFQLAKACSGGSPPGELHSCHATVLPLGIMLQKQTR
jgi:hypothetical protein